MQSEAQQASESLQSSLVASALVGLCRGGEELRAALVQEGWVLAALGRWAASEQAQLRAAALSGLGLLCTGGRREAAGAAEQGPGQGQELRPLLLSLLAEAAVAPMAAALRAPGGGTSAEGCLAALLALATALRSAREVLTALGAGETLGALFVGVPPVIAGAEVRRLAAAVCAELARERGGAELLHAGVVATALKEVRETATGRASSLLK